MLLTRRGSWLSALLLSASLLNGPALRPAQAQDDAPKAKPDAAAKDGAAKEGAEGEKKKGPPAPPEGNDPKELKLYLTRVMRARPPEQTPEAISRFLENVRFAGEAVLKKDIEDEELLAQAASLQIQALEAMARFGDESAEEKLEKLKEALSQDKRAGVKAVVEVSQFESKLAKLPELEPAEQKKLIEELAAKLAAPKLIPDYIGMTQSVGMLLESLDQPEQAKAALVLFADKLEERKDDEPQVASLIKRIVPSLRGTAKRLDLIGHPIEIKGTALDGQPFDIENWKGKVVLVDFWATWCGPCIQEMPNVIRHYKGYHDKGFEVVGISLDESADDLKEFLKENKIPWVTLFDAKEENAGWNNPLARKYGISGIPTCILVDQKGNVVSLSARGEKLEEWLTKLLGPAEEKEAAAPKKDE